MALSRFSRTAAGLLGLLVAAVLPVRAQSGPPTLAYQPPPCTVPYGGTGSFTVSTGGGYPQTYQWYKNGVAIPGTNSTTLLIYDATTADVGNYSITVTNASGSVTSNSASLSVTAAVAPSFSSSLQSASVVYGGYYYLYASPDGSPPFSFQWFHDGNPIANATAANYTVTYAKPADAGTYYVRATNAVGSADSNSATLSVAAAVPVSITQQPTSQSVQTYARIVDLAVTASGTTPFTYQWYKDGVALTGEIQSTLRLTNVPPSLAGTYTVKVTNAAGSVTSSGAVIALGDTAPPGPMQNSAGLLQIEVGADGYYSASTAGPGSQEDSYFRWYQNGTLVSSGTSETLRLTQFIPSYAGDYLGTITTAGGTSSLPPYTFTARTIVRKTGHYVAKAVRQQGTVVYFLFDSTSQILRYDLANSTWLTPVTLPQKPTAMVAAPEGIYVSFGLVTSRYALDLSSSSTFATSTDKTFDLFLNDSFIFLAGNSGYPSASITAVRRSDGGVAKVSTGDYSSFLLQGFEVSSVSGRAYGWRGATSPSYLQVLALGADGTVSLTSSLFARASEGDAVVISPDGSLVLPNNGTIFNASDSSLRAAVANGGWDDACFLADGKLVTLRGQQLTLYDSSSFRVIGAKALPKAAFKLVAQNSTVTAFLVPASTGSPIDVATVTETALTAGAPTPASPVSTSAASTRSFIPAYPLVDKNGLVYLLDRETRNILVWSPMLRAYQASLPLVGVPDRMTYSAALHRLYICYSDRHITYIDLGISPNENYLTTVASNIYDFEAVDNQLYLRLSEGNSTGTYRTLYSSSGTLVASSDSSSSLAIRSYWSGSKQSLYEYDFQTLLSVPIQSGAFGTIKAASNVNNATLPLRFSADGTSLATGQGTIFDAGTLALIANLGTGTIADAAWSGNALLTLKQTGFGSQIQVWTGASYTTGTTTALQGYPVALLPLPSGQVLAITSLGSGPVYTILSSSGSVVSQDLNSGIAAMPPLISKTSPTSLSMSVGGSGTLSVIAAGDNLTYQWQKYDINIPGATRSTLDFSNAQTGDTGRYNLVVTNPFGSAITPDIAVNVPPLDQQPVLKTMANQTVLLGRSAMFMVEATGNNLAYQWYLNDVAIPGATASTLAFASAQTSDNGTYKVNVSSGNRSVMSNRATLTVVIDPSPPSPTAVAPTISTQPSSVTTFAGSSVTFSVVATGTPAPTYQWNFNGIPITGATHSTYSITAVQAANAGNYSVTVTNSSGSVTSQTAVLTLTTSSGAPTITSQPASRTANPGGTVVFTVDATNSTGSSSHGNVVSNAVGTISYSWYHNGVPLTDGGGVNGAQSSTLVLTGSAAEAGSYSCLVGNGTGSVFSQPAILTVNSTSDIGRLVNISCRSQVGTGSNVLIAGFVVGGSNTTGSQKILARAAGPALVAYSVPGTLPDPELKLYSGNNTLAANAGWNGNAEISSVAAYVGAFAWTNPTSHDAAVTTALAGGVYSAVVAGQSGNSGVALVELYDATQAGAYVPSTPRLVNISARVPVGTAGNVLIAGFVVGGSTSRTVLIRASGPALNAYGVANTLPTPQLKLYQGDAILAANSAWGGNTQIASVASIVGAFAWPDPASKDSALLITLPPGVYSAQVSGANGDTGVALVEVYEVP